MPKQAEVTTDNTEVTETHEEEITTELSYDDEFSSMLAQENSSEPETATDDEDVSEQEDVSADDDDSIDESSDDSTDSSATDTADPAGDQEPDPYAWISALPEEVKKQAEALKHSAISDRNRVAAYNRHLAEARRELEEARAAASRSSSKSTAEKDTSKASVSAAPELPPKFKQLQEDFPEFAEAVQELVAQDRARYEARLSEVVTPLEERRRKEEYDAFWSAVVDGSKKILKTEDGGYWDVHEVVSSDDFNAWLQLQPKSVQAAARVPDPNEALYVLSQYKRDYDVAVAELQAAEAPNVSANSTAKADKTKTRREKIKATSTVPGSKPAAVESAQATGDHEALFNAMVG